MKKFTKAISTLLVVALVVAMATVSAFAAEAESLLLFRDLTKQYIMKVLTVTKTKSGATLPVWCLK